MNLYDVALAIFLKKNLPPYVTDISVKQIKSGAEDSIAAAKLFMEAVQADKEASKVLAEVTTTATVGGVVVAEETQQLELPFPEALL